ncbi:hypothetical protein ES703_93483 [subsurface metagenome]
MQVKLDSFSAEQIVNIDISNLRDTELTRSNIGNRRDGPEPNFSTLAYPDNVS